MTGYKEAVTLPQLKRPAHQILCDPRASNSQVFPRARSVRGEDRELRTARERHSAGGTTLTGRTGHVTQVLHLRGGREAGGDLSEGTPDGEFYFQCPHTYYFVQI